LQLLFHKNDRGDSGTDFLKPLNLLFFVHQQSIGVFVYTGAAKGNGKKLGCSCMLQPLRLLPQASSPSQAMCISFIFSLLNLAHEPKRGKLFRYHFRKSGYLFKCEI